MNLSLLSVPLVLEPRIVNTSIVKGQFIYEYLMNSEDSKIRIDETGYPNIQWPENGGIGPVIPPNFKAMILLNTNWSSGIIKYQYATNVGWVTESQEIQLAI